jgi:hypothetical protein
MTDLHTASIEKKVHLVTRVPGPDDAFISSLWERLEQNPLPLQPAVEKQPWYRRPVWITLAVLLVLLAALFVGFGPRKVSAFLKRILGFNDAGLQAVREAGLVTDLGLTAEPTLIRSTDYPTDFPNDVVPLSLSQTVEDITVTLDWVYVDEGRMTIALTTTTLPQELVFEMPNPIIDGVPSYGLGRSSQSSGDYGTQILFDITQVVQVENDGATVDISLDIPLVNQNNPDKDPLAIFHFDLQDIPVYRGMNIPLTQTASVTLDGVEIQLKSIRVMPSTTELEICYDFPPGDERDFYLPQPSLKIDDGPEEKGFTFHNLGESEGKHCAKLEFMLGNAIDGDQMTFKVDTLYVPIPEELPDEKIYAANETLAEYGLEIAPAEGDYDDGQGGWVFVETPQWELYPEDPRWLVIDALREKMTGPWIFYIDLPSDEEYSSPNESPTPEPVRENIDSQTQGDVTVTLDWVFVDALRAGLGYTITGLPDEPEAIELYGMTYLVDALGNPIGGSGIGSSNITRVPDQPGVLQGTYSVGFLEPLAQAESDFQWIITLDGTKRNEIIAEFPLPPDAPCYPPGVYPPQLPEGFIGTYTFDFTAPVLPMTVREDIPSVTANGLEIQIPRAEISPSTSKIMLCYEKPSERDWWPEQVTTIGSGNDETPWHSAMPVFDRDFSVFPESKETTSIWSTPPEIQEAEHGRCLVVSFLLGSGDSNHDLVVTIPYLEISPPEVFPEAELAAAREILHAQGIEMTYETWEAAGGGGGGGVKFTTLPEGMTWEMAHYKFLEALGYIYPGPWVLTISP